MKKKYLNILKYLLQILKMNQIIFMIKMIIPRKMKLKIQAIWKMIKIEIIKKPPKQNKKNQKIKKGKKYLNNTDDENEN